MSQAKNTQHKQFITAVFLFLFVTFSGFQLCGQEQFLPPRPVIQAESAVCIDYTTGTVLYEKSGNMIIPPASLTKLMTIHLTLKEVKEGIISLDDIVPIPEEAWWQNLPRGSSLMFLGPHQRVTVRELLTGLAVSSGNDAAIALAEYVGATMKDFIRLMNQEARNLGLSHFHFEDASGLNEHNTITAREYAEFCRIYIRLHPKALAMFNSKKTFTYPKQKNMEDGYAAHPITQANRNTLLGVYSGLDGLKSGYIDESGYNVALTAKRNGRRVIAVLLGGTGQTHLDGRARLAKDGTLLLDYCFDNFITLRPEGIEPVPVRVWKGKENEVFAVPGRPIHITIPKKAVGELKTRIECPSELIAPVNPDDIIGHVFVSLEGKNIGVFPLMPDKKIERAGIFKRFIHSFLLFIRKLFYSNE